jgi:hypothetical protein
VGVGKATIFFLIFAFLTAALITGCGPNMRPNSNAFDNGPGTSITLGDNTAPGDGDVALSERASKMTFGDWQKEPVDKNFSNNITNLYVAAIEWDEAQKNFRLPIVVSVQEAAGKTVPVQFSLTFSEPPRAGGQALTAMSRDGRYTLNMVCSSDDCSEKVFRLKRLADGGVAVMKNIRAEQVLVQDGAKDDSDGIPVVQHYTEIKEGKVTRQMTDRDGSARSLEPYKNQALLKKTKFRHAIDVPALTDFNYPGISKKTLSEKLVTIGELMIHEKTHIPRNACNRFVLWNLAAAGYKINSEPDSHNFLSLFIDQQFKGWHYESYRANERTQLINRLNALPERKGVVLQYGRGKAGHGHVLILFREGAKFYAMDSSLDGHPPEKKNISLNKLFWQGLRTLTVIFPPDIK